MSGSSFSVKNSWLEIPVVDEAQRVAELMAGKNVPLSKYKVLLTHDVDKLRNYHYFTEPMRYFIGDLLKRGKGLTSFRRLKAYASMNHGLQ